MTQDVDFDIALDWIPKDRIYNGFMSRQDFDEFSDHSTLVNFEPVTRWMADVYLRGAMDQSARLSTIVHRVTTTILGTLGRIFDQ